MSKRIARVVERWLMSRMESERHLGFRLIGNPSDRAALREGLERLRVQDVRMFNRLRRQFDNLGEGLVPGWCERDADLPLLPRPGPTPLAAELAQLATHSAATWRFGDSEETADLRDLVASRAWLRTALRCAQAEPNPEAWRQWAHETFASWSPAGAVDKRSLLERVREGWRLIREWHRLVGAKERQH